MKTPLILITYGFTKKLCTWEEDNIHKVPFFSEPILASLFISSFKKHMKEFIKDKDQLQIQVCNNPQHVLDMLKIISVVAPTITIVYNPSPIGEDPYDAIEKISCQFQNSETTINKYYDIEEAIEVFQPPNNQNFYQK